MRFSAISLPSEHWACRENLVNLLSTFTSLKLPQVALF